MATKGGHIDFMFLSPPYWPMDPLLLPICVFLLSWSHNTGRNHLCRNIFTCGCGIHFKIWVKCTRKCERIHMRVKNADSGSFCSSESAWLHWPNLPRNFRSHVAQTNFNHEIEWQSTRLLKTTSTIEAEVFSANVSRKSQYKDICRRTIEMLQCACILKVNYCLKVRNLHLK